MAAKKEVALLSKQVDHPSCRHNHWAVDAKLLELRPSNADRYLNSMNTEGNCEATLVNQGVQVAARILRRTPGRCNCTDEVQLSWARLRRRKINGYKTRAVEVRPFPIFSAKDASLHTRWAVSALYQHM